MYNLCLSHVFDQLPRDGYSLLGAEAAVTVLLSSLQFLNSLANSQHQLSSGAAYFLWKKVALPANL